jgi:hypothetical protein
MQAVRWMTIYLIGVILAFGGDSLALAASAQQTEPALVIAITTAQAEVTVGAPMTWRVMLAPSAQQSLGPIELRPGDTRIWAWPDGFQTVETLTNTIVLDILAAPLVSGDLNPILEARYTAGGEPQTQLVVGHTSVQAEPVERRIQAGVVPRQGTVREGERLAVELWIRNDSPFALTQVQVYGSGTDLAWEEPPTPAEIESGKTYSQALCARVDGQHPRPQLSIEYAWTDVTGVSRAQTRYINAEDVALEESFIARVPNELLGIVVGVATGALVTIIPKWIEERRSRKHQQKINRQHVYGLLRLMALQSEYACDNGTFINLAPLEAVFEKEGLFAIAEEDELAQNMRDLWKKAERHNTGLDRPGAAQRTEELRRAAGELRNRLDVLGAAEWHKRPGWDAAVGDDVV